jgi:hypothetical protein
VIQQTITQWTISNIMTQAYYTVDIPFVQFQILLSEGGTLSRVGSQAVLNINTSSAGASSA